jgi:hypothetical protein
MGREQMDVREMSKLVLELFNTLLGTSAESDAYWSGPLRVRPPRATPARPLSDPCR